MKTTIVDNGDCKCLACKAKTLDVDDDLFEPAQGPARIEPELPPAFRAGYDSECSEGDHISTGEMIRADGAGGYVHADGQCDGTAFL
jgi:hypothetical protein